MAASFFCLPACSSTSFHKHNLQDVPSWQEGACEGADGEGHRMDQGDGGT